jgi:hypothetical protein
MSVSQEAADNEAVAVLKHNKSYSIFRSDRNISDCYVHEEIKSKLNFQNAR